MGLNIDRNDPAGKERRTVGQNQISQVRVYRTISGKLVGENNPEAATLAYAVGSEIPAHKVAEYDAFIAETDEAEVDPAGDPERRAALRERVAPSGTAPKDHTQPIGEKLATELADEARMIANSDAETRVAAAQEADPDRVVAEVRIARTEDGDLVAESDPRATFLMYAVGDEIVDPAHKVAYRKLAAKATDDEPSDEPSDGDSGDTTDPTVDPTVDPATSGDPAKDAAPATGAKAAKAPANKAGDQAANKSNQ